MLQISSFCIRAASCEIISGNCRQRKTSGVLKAYGSFVCFYFLGGGGGGGVTPLSATFKSFVGCAENIVFYSFIFNLEDLQGKDI